MGSLILQHQRLALFNSALKSRSTVELEIFGTKLKPSGYVVLFEKWDGMFVIRTKYPEHLSSSTSPAGYAFSLSEAGELKMGVRFWGPGPDFRPEDFFRDDPFLGDKELASLILDETLQDVASKVDSGAIRRSY